MRKILSSIGMLFIPLFSYALTSPSELLLTPTATTVTLTWQDNSDDETGFKIFRDDKLIDIVDENITTYTDTFLMPETMYNYTLKATNSVYFSPKQIQIADEFISIFENSTLTPQYAYTEELGDGRGITAGRIGFTSATGDMLRVIERYTAQVPDNKLASYIPELKHLEYLRYEVGDKNASASVKNLINKDTNLSKDWADIANNDPLFRKIQDKATYAEYLFPALELGHSLGLQYPISILSLYDTAIQHGYEGLESTANQVKKASPIEGGDEESWLRAFNAIRRDILQNDPHWKDSVVRVDEFIDLLDSKNYFLKPFKMVIERYDDEKYHLGTD